MTTRDRVAELVREALFTERSAVEAAFEALVLVLGIDAVRARGEHVECVGNGGPFEGRWHEVRVDGVPVWRGEWTTTHHGRGRPEAWGPGEPVWSEALHASWRARWLVDVATLPRELPPTVH